jgi:hypothetical protein
MKEQERRADRADQSAREAQAARRGHARAANRARAEAKTLGWALDRAERRTEMAKQELGGAARRQALEDAPYAPSGGRGRRERLRHNQRHRHRGGSGRQQGLTQTARPDPDQPRQKPHAPPRHRPPQTNPGRRAGVGQHMGAVAAPTTAGHRRPQPADRRGQEGSDHAEQPAGGHRMAQPPVPSEQRDDNKRQPQHRADGCESPVAAGEPPAPMHARAETVGVGQPRAPDGPGGHGGKFERLQLERPRRRYGTGDADQLMGGAAHAQQANRDAGQFPATSPSRPSKPFGQRHDKPVDELDAEEAA